jgi:hypothetical protein
LLEKVYWWRNAHLPLLPHAWTIFLLPFGVGSKRFWWAWSMWSKARLSKNGPVWKFRAMRVYVSTLFEPNGSAVGHLGAITKEAKGHA